MKIKNLLLSQKNHNRKLGSGFTLLELSMSILIIGIIVLGIARGSTIIFQSKVNAARSLTSSSPVNSIADLLLWLEPTGSKVFNNNSYINDNNQITSWYDFNTRNLSSLVATNIVNPPVFKLNGINGIPSIYFKPSSSQSLSITNIPFANTSTFTIFAVVQNIAAIQAAGVWGPVLSIGDSGTEANQNTGFCLYKDKPANANTWAFTVGGVTQSNQSYSSLTGSYQPIILTGWYDGLKPTLYENNVSVAAAGSPFTSYVAPSSSNFYIGTNSDSTYFAGYISEIIVFGRNLNWTEIKSVNSYLSKKYNIKISNFY